MASKITYDDKISLTTSALPRANKCTDDDLNEIKQVVNNNADETDENTTNIEDLQQLVEEKSTYSTIEKQIGTWIDGKPLYQITLTGTKVNGTDLEIAIPANIDKVCSVEGRLKALSGTSYSLDRSEGENYTRTEISTASNLFKLKSSGISSYFNGDVVATLRYTKTTD